MEDLSPPEVKRLVQEANAARWQPDASGDDASREPSGLDVRQAERRLDDLFGSSHTLAIYGTLAPGQPNHHVVAPLGGEWTKGVVEGDLLSAGWGATLGYPGFRPRVGGEDVTVHVLSATSLATAWPDLDSFEGPEYRRILVPVFEAKPARWQADERPPYTVASLYSLIEAIADGQSQALP